MHGPDKSNTPVNTQPVAAAGAPGPNGASIQLKGNHLLTSNDMTSFASKGMLTAVFSKTHTYEDIVDAVAEYHSDAVPNDNYSIQYLKLVNIKRLVGIWENKYGPVNREVPPPGIMGYKDEDKRRIVLLQLTLNLAEEMKVVLLQGYQAATVAHERDRNALLQYATEALTSNDPLLKNSADWILTARMTKLYAVTSTGDAGPRVMAAGQDPVTADAFFPEAKGGDGDILSGPSTYNPNDLKDNTNVFIYPGGKKTGGWNKPYTIAVTNASSRPKEEIQTTLKHEVQHDADKNRSRESLAGFHKSTEDLENHGIDINDAARIMENEKTGRNNSQTLRQQLGEDFPDKLNAIRKLVPEIKAERNIGRYKTEYRAYSYQEGATPGPMSAMDNTVQNKTFEGYQFSERQLHIFKKIYDNYPHTKEGWNENTPLSNGLTFRQAVVGYWNPDTEGANKFNSIRIDEFYETLDLIGSKAFPTAGESAYGLMFSTPVTNKQSDPNGSDINQIITSVQSLTPEEAQFILTAPLYHTKLNNHLDGEAKQKVMDALTKRTHT